MGVIMHLFDNPIGGVGSSPTNAYTNIKSLDSTDSISSVGSTESASSAEAIKGKCDKKMDEVSSRSLLKKFAIGAAKCMGMLALATAAAALIMFTGGMGVLAVGILAGIFASENSSKPKESAGPALNGFQPLDNSGVQKKEKDEDEDVKQSTGNEINTME